MGYCVLESSSFLQSALFHSLGPPFSSSSSCCPAVLSSSHWRVARRKQSAAMASMHPEGAKISCSKKRKALLLVGLSAMSFLQFRAAPAAVGALAKGKQDSKMAEPPGPQMQDSPSYQQQNEIEHGRVYQAPGNTFVSLLNELGIMGSGVLGALYAIAQEEKADMQLTIESMNTSLTEKEASNASLEKEFERKLLLQQEEHQQQIRKLKEDEVLLFKQLTSTKGKVTALGHEVQNEKRLVGELELQVDLLHSSLTQAGEDKDMLEAKLRDKLGTIDVLQDRANLLSLEIKDEEKNIDVLTSKLGEKEAEFTSLRSAIEQTKVDIDEANFALAHLKIEQLKAKEELDLKNSHINDLEMKISSLLAERDDIDRKFHTLQKEYDGLKSEFMNKAASDTELLTKKDEEKHQLEEKLGLALTEAKSKQIQITNITNERESLRAMLEEERCNVKILRDDLQITQETFRHSKFQVSDVLKQLQESKRINDELVSEVSRIETESSEAEKMLNASLDETRSTAKLLSIELSLVKDVLKRTKEELAASSDELKATSEARDRSKKELLEAYKKVEAAEHKLKEERKTITALNRELEASQKLIEKHSEARKDVEKKMDAATKSLDEMNKKALFLSKDVENVNSLNATLEAEKERLYESLEQKNVTKEAQDTRNVITRLGAERERLEKKVKKFEEEIAAAKGEILRLRRQITLCKGSASEQHKSANNREAAAIVVPKRNGGRSRRAGPASQVSQQET